nr:immunoglobulin light chain junction region [Macaca mulatta]MOX42102.1 immunoglobulin light chain junction region [Macaca mulatta]MOX42530.1 immunoglobulin light chain junction region [Macaca mulatta]MOX42878.1 immunoglobulin light chain junction region [Macaca mulatta]MOX43223.1 immunoglobulin light chain junction region [Macaca mulatta]
DYHCSSYAGSSTYIF